MNHRWCIMASPRSGSNYLEELIFRNNLKKVTSNLDPSISLSEYLHHIWYSYHDSNNLVQNGKELFNSDFRIKFRNNINYIIENKSNPIVMRIFPQLWHKNEINLDDFFSFLQNNGFKFVYLRRNIKDRLISLTVAQYTDTWNRRIIKGKSFIINGENTVSLSQDNKIIIDLNTVAKNYYDTRMTDYYLNTFNKKFSGNTINYETINNDCKKIGIIVRDTYIKKLYDVNYSDLIDNYQEVVDFIEFFKHG